MLSILFYYCHLRPDYQLTKLQWTCPLCILLRFCPQMLSVGCVKAHIVRYTMYAPDRSLPSSSESVFPHIPPLFCSYSVLLATIKVLFGRWMHQILVPATLVKVIIDLFAYSWYCTRDTSQLLLPTQPGSPQNAHLLQCIMQTNSPMKEPSPERKSEPALVTMAQVLYFAVKIGALGNSSLRPCLVNGLSSPLIVRMMPTFFLRLHISSCTLLLT